MMRDILDAEERYLDALDRETPPDRPRDPETPPTPAPAPVGRPDDLLTLGEVAEMTRTTPGTLRWWRHLGTRGPKSFRIGRRVMYRRGDVDAWLAAQHDGG